MDGSILILVIILLVLFSGSIMGWVNHFAVRNLRREVQALRDQLMRGGPKADAVEPLETSQPEAPFASQNADIPTDESVAPEATPQPEQTPLPSSVYQKPVNTSPPAWWEHLKTHWMVWLGAVCVGLAGIFLAAYSIEQDYLGPQARLSLGLIIGALLHVAAEVLRRRAQMRYEALAGLAAGASVVLYATLLASVQLYELWPTGLVFFLLAAVSLGTMILALWHGPLIAIVGLVGAYAAPLLLGDSGGNLQILLGYCFVVACSGFWLLSRVYRSWLLALTLGGALAWWALIVTSEAQLLGLLIYLVALAHAAMVLPLGNYLSYRRYSDQPRCTTLSSFFGFDSFISRDRVVSLMFLLIAFAITMHLGQYNSAAPAPWILMTMILWAIHAKDDAFRLIPWLWVPLTLISITLSHLSWGPQWPVFPLEFGITGNVVLLYIVMLSLCGYAFAVHASPGHHNQYPALTLSLAALTPLGCLTLLWVLNPHGFEAWYWAAVCAGLGAFYADRARRRWRTVADAQVVWWFIAAHGAYSLAAVMALSQASLTLALAVQVATIVWLMQRFELPVLRWLLRAVMTLIIVRLTLNPWLPDYATSSRLAADTWVFWTYGGTLAFVALAHWLAAGLKETQRWLEGAILHLLVLFIAVCVRYALYDGEVFVWRYTFTEASLYTSLLAALGLVYAVRARRAGSSAALLRTMATLLQAASVVQYLWLAVIKNPLWERVDTLGTTPIANLLLLSFGLPVLLFALASRWGVIELRRAMSLLAAGALWWFVTLEVRHLWHGQLWWQDVMSDGELYSYSMSWLVLAVAAMVFGGWKHHQDAYRGGMALLVLVIAKLFLFDLSDLTGLWRVLSFMGMGLCLLGLGWVHQLTLRQRHPASTLQ